MLVLTFLGLSLPPSANAHNGPSIPGAFGTATIDGLISESYACIGPISQYGFTFRICHMNDQTFNYYALEISDQSFDDNDFARFYFDDEHDGTSPARPGQSCEFNASSRENLLDFFGDGFRDLYYCGGSGPYGDETDHGSGVRVAGGLGSIYEIQYPLCSGDVNDYCLSLGSIIGWCFVFVDHGGVNVPLPVGCTAEARTGDQGGFGDIAIQTATQTLTQTQAQSESQTGTQLLPPSLTSVSLDLQSIGLVGAVAIIAITIGVGVYRAKGRRKIAKRSLEQTLPGRASFCINCGTKIRPPSNFCGTCGHPTSID